MVSVGEDSGHLDGGVADIGIGDARAGVADVATVKASRILLPDGLAVYIGVEGHIHGHASGSDDDVAAVYELLGDIVALLGSIGIVAASYQSDNSGNCAQHNWRTYSSDLSVSCRSTASSHFELLGLDILPVGILEEIEDVYALGTALLALSASYANLIHIGE